MAHLTLTTGIITFGQAVPAVRVCGAVALLKLIRRVGRRAAGVIGIVPAVAAEVVVDDRVDVNKVPLRVAIHNAHIVLIADEGEVSPDQSVNLFFRCVVLFRCPR